MNRYRCDDCGEEFNEDEAGRYQDDMGVADPCRVFKTLLCCPYCRCEDIVVLADLTGELPCE